MDNKDKLPEEDENEEEMEFYEDEDMDFLDDYEEEVDPLYRSLEIVDSNVDKFMSISTADAVFGEPVEIDETLIIPAAELMSTMGFGVGYGGGEGMNEEDMPVGNGEGVGGGGGGYAFSRPVAVIVADKDGVRVEPVVDVTKLGLTALAALGFMVGAILKIRRGR